MITVTDLQKCVEIDVHGKKTVVPKNLVTVKATGTNFVTLSIGNHVVCTDDYYNFDGGYPSANDVVDGISSILYNNSNLLYTDEYTVFVSMKSNSKQYGTINEPFNTIQAAIDYLQANPNPLNIYHIIHLGGLIEGDFTIPDSFTTVFIESLGIANSSIIEPNFLLAGDFVIEGLTPKFIFFGNLTLQGTAGQLITFTGGENVGLIFNGCQTSYSAFITATNPLPLFVFANGYMDNTNLDLVSGSQLCFIANTVIHNTPINISSNGISDGIVTMQQIAIQNNIPGATITCGGAQLKMIGCEVNSVTHSGMVNVSNNCLTMFSTFVGDLATNTVGTITLTDGNYKVYNSVYNLIPNSAIEL